MSRSVGSVQYVPASPETPVDASSKDTNSPRAKRWASSVWSAAKAASRVGPTARIVGAPTKAAANCPLLDSINTGNVIVHPSLTPIVRALQGMLNGGPARAVG